MCGIFGVINGDPQKFKMLGLLNESRGTDSWGVYNFDSVVKDIGAFRQAMMRHADKLCHRSMLGHTRAATHGTVSFRNAHPFEYENIIGAHNGVIINWQGYKTSLLRNASSLEDESYLDAMQVDSEILIYLIARGRMAEFSNLMGYAAMWWVDKNKPGKFFLYSGGHQFYFKATPRNKMGTFYFSSQSDHLSAVGIIGATQSEEDNIMEIDLITAECRVIDTQSLATTTVYRGHRPGAWTVDDPEYWYESTHSPAWGGGSYNKGGLARSDYFDTAYERYRGYKKAISEVTTKEDRTAQPLSWSPKHGISRKQRKRLVKAVESIRKQVKEHSVHTPQLSHIKELCGCPTRTATCDNCNVEYPVSIFKQDNIGSIVDGPGCGRKLPTMEALWCPGCKRIVTYGEAEIDTGEAGPVMGCNICDSFLEDLYLGYSPVMADVRWEPVKEEKKEGDK